MSSLKRTAAATIAGGVLVAGLALPAVAATKSGTKDCRPLVATAAATGRQSSPGITLTVTAGGTTKYSTSTNAITADSYNSVASWSASSSSLIASESYGFCYAK